MGVERAEEPSYDSTWPAGAESVEEPAYDPFMLAGAESAEEWRASFPGIGIGAGAHNPDLQARRPKIPRTS